MPTLIRFLASVYGSQLCPIALLWVAVLAFYWPLFTPFTESRRFIPAGDFTHQAYPFHAFAAAEWAAGRVPHWAPQIYAGHPFQADPQTAVFSPLGLIINLVAGRDGLSFLVLEWQVVVNFLLAATFAYLLVRQLTGNRLAGVTGGLVYTLGGFLTSYPVQQLPILETAIWLPLVIFFVERGFYSRRQVYFAAAGMSAGIAWLGGHPQTWMLAAYASLAYFIYRGVVCRPGWWFAGGGLALAGLFAAGMAAVQWLPTAELLTVSNRQALLPHEAGHGYDFGALLNSILPLWRTERGPYLGIAALLLGLTTLRRGRATAFWAGLAGVALVMSLGDRTLLFSALYAVVPGFSLFKDQERSMLLFSLAGAVLAGYGMRQWLDGWRVPFRWAGAAATAALLGGGALWILATLGYGSSDVRALWRACWVSLPFCLAGLSLLWWRPPPTWRAAQAYALVLLLALDLFLVNQGNNLGSQPPVLPPDTVAASQALPSDEAPYRVRAGDHSVLAPNDSLLLKLENMAGDSPMLSRWTLALLQSPFEWRLWQLFGVRFILTRSQLGQGTALFRQDGALYTYRMEYPLPRAYMVRDFLVAPDDRSALEAALAPRFNPGRTVVLNRFPTLPLDGPELPADQRVRFVRYEPQILEIETTVTDNALLVVSDTWHPAWQATIDGRPVSIMRANLAFRAIEVPAGGHLVRMEYHPMTFYAGAAITLLSLLGFLFLVARNW